MDEDNSSKEPSSSETSRKRTRGPTLCKKLKKRIANQKKECNISFNEYGHPIGDMLKDFRTYLGSVVRCQVDINIESWDLVNQGLKDAIWDDIKTRWKLDDSRKKNILEKAGKQWRDFKCKLTKNFLRKGKDPCECYPYLSQEQWEQFKKRRETDEFKAISVKAQESQKHNDHVHFLGRSGYDAKKAKWSVDDPITALEDLESINPSILSSDRTGRSFDWLRARTKQKEDGGYYFPNEQTRKVFDKMGELQTQVLDGSWTPQGHDDLLSRALGRKEHGGRVRGVGGGAKIKEVFGSMNNKHSGVISVDDLAIITQEITMKVQKECEDKMNQMMNMKLEGIFNHLKQIGVSYPDFNFVNDIGTPQTVKSSCQSVDRQEHFSSLKGPTPCNLWVIDQAIGKVIAARGTVFPASQGDNLIHNNPIASHNVRVSIDDVVAEYQLTQLPVPCDEHETVGSAIGSFVQWPKDLVTLGQEPISLEKKTGHEKTPKNDVKVSKKVESKGSVTPIKKPTPPLLGDDTNSSEHCRSLRFLLNKRTSGTKDVVFKFEEIGKQPIYVTPEDVHQFLKLSWINISILEIFLKHVETLCNELNETRFAFMLPSRLAIPSKRDYQQSQEACDYMTTSLIANKERHFILAPYIQDDHWMLLLFSLKESVIYVFDSLKKERDIRLKTPVQTAFKLYTINGGLRNNRKEFLILHTEVQCPQQQGGTECGFFVMRYMHDIIMRSQKNPDFMNWKVGLGSRSYTRKEISEIRELWARFFIRECL